MLLLCKCITSKSRRDEEFSAPLNTARLNSKPAAKKAAAHLYKKCYFAALFSPRKNPAITLFTKRRRHRSLRRRNPASFVLRRPQQVYGLSCPDAGCTIIHRTNQSTFSDATRWWSLDVLGLTSATLSGTPSPRTSL